MNDYIIAIDQGTTSTRAIIFDQHGASVASGQLEHKQIFPHAGWVEHDPREIWLNTREVIGLALSKADITRHSIRAVGITNQRETTLVWDKKTGEPVYNAIVWQDTRTQPFVDEIAAGDYERYRARTGLPLAPYFPATKIAWILDNVENARARAEAGDLIFGTIDTWLVWNLTGGINGGIHVTDVTNAALTLLLNIETLQWDEGLLADFGIPRSMLPEVRSSSEIYGVVSDQSLLREVPIAGILGDQNAATFGQAAFDAGEAKNTYGTGNFLLFNTGKKLIQSANGMITTVAYKLGKEPAYYALEGQIAVTGSLVQWLRDNLGIIATAPEIEALAKTVDDNGGAYFVPAFSGLLAPYWRAEARGALVGLTRYVNKGHIARAVLESIAFQSAEVFDAVNADSGVALTELKVDGGAISNDLLGQIQADVLQVPVVRPVVAETTALGAAYVAGLAVGYWSGLDELRANWQEGRRWVPAATQEERDRTYRLWKKAVTKTFNWADEDVN